MLTAVGGWVVFSLTHAITTWWAHRGRQGESLRSALVADPDSYRQRSPLAEFVVGTGAHSFSSSLAIMALIAVMALVIYPELRRDALVLGFGVALLAVVWFDVIITYAVHYARLDLTRGGGLRFPNEDESAEPSFVDYQYLATGVQATFGTTDVTVTTTAMRRTVRNHALLAFVFNSVIVALVVSLVLTLR
ncbi:DUF1345 domain-containing protein [Aestuariimicrobium ganziense]|uniref:DUF1345 domain-containing protein n=1 Tax=Aestuariimicrobium ganziense TaxID=2773677 RepID=UPI001941B658|nr:DUF1345 domain-containing protein [Aestuariimicrobium ganziense]